MRRLQQSLSRHAARINAPAEVAGRRGHLLEAFGRQDAGLHATAIGAPSASFLERPVLGQLGFGVPAACSFASSASVLSPFRGSPRLLRADGDPTAADVSDEDDEDDDEDWDGVYSGALSDIPEMEAMSRKKQQFLLLQLLKGRGVAKEVAEEPDRTMDMHVVDVNRTVKVTKGGSLMRFTALVVVGNGDGVVGWAKGKAPEVSAAVDKAYWRASRSLFFFERFEKHTIFHPSEAKFGKTKIQLAPLPAGHGVRANGTIRAVCELAGIKDLRGKVYGSHNPNSTIRALFEALDAVRSPDEVAQARGRTVIRVNPGSDFKRHSPYGVLT